jgi:hypothetical protein
MKWKINVRWSILHSYHSCVRGVSTGYWLDSRGWIPGRGKMFLLSTTSRLVLGPTQAPIQWVPRAVSRGVKTFANYNYFYIMPYLISRVPSFLIESRATPGISASILYSLADDIIVNNPQRIPEDHNLIKHHHHHQTNLEFPDTRICCYSSVQEIVFCYGTQDSQLSPFESRHQTVH